MYKINKDESGSSFCLFSFGIKVKLSRSQADALRDILPRIERGAAEAQRC